MQMSNNTQKASITILGIDTDAALDVTNAAAARRAQIAFGAMLLHNESIHYSVTVPSIEDAFAALTAKRMVNLIAGNG
jgi:hypothetical protein